MEEQGDVSEESTDGTNQGSAWQKDDRLSRGRRKSGGAGASYTHSRVVIRPSLLQGMDWGLAGWQREVCKSMQFAEQTPSLASIPSCSCVVRRLLADTKHEYVSSSVR